MKSNHKIKKESLSQRPFPQIYHLTNHGNYFETRKFLKLNQKIFVVQCTRIKTRLFAILEMLYLEATRRPQKDVGKNISGTLATSQTYKM